MTLTTRWTGGLFALLVLAYIAVFVRFSPLPLQDYPNHLARAFVMADLIFHQGAQFGQQFQYHFLFTSYILGDLLLTTLVQLTGVAAAGAIWVTFVFLCLPCALFLYLRARDSSVEVTLLLLFISLYFSSDTFFALGFLEFRLSIALVLVALALAEWCRKRWSGVSFAIYTALIVVAYLTHLGAIAFIGAAVGAASVWRVVFRKAPVIPEICLLLPVIGMIGWHFLGAAAYRQSEDVVAQTPGWGTLAHKISHLNWDFIRYNRANDARVVAALAAFLLACLYVKRAGWRAGFGSPEVLEPLGLGVLFLTLYFAFPNELVEASNIDVRALAMAPIFLLLGVLNLAPSTAGRGGINGPLVWLAAAVACVNLGYLTLQFQKESVWLAQYRAVVADIPDHASVLPVFTGRRIANIHDHLHVASFAVMDRHALIPYLFAGDAGHPMKYFRYRNHPYLPDELWYQRGLDSEVDWREVSRRHRYLLIMKPYVADRIPLTTRIVSENGVAALLAIE